MIAFVDAHRHRPAPISALSYIPAICQCPRMIAFDFSSGRAGSGQQYLTAAAFRSDRDFSHSRCQPCQPADGGAA